MFYTITNKVTMRAFNRIVKHTRTLVQSASSIQHARQLSTILETSHRRAYVPRRACIYVPGSDRRKIDKARSLGADCVVLDCEDGIAINRKDVARETIYGVLDSTDFGRSECAVRVNSEVSGLMEDDLNTIMRAERSPSTIFLPKVEYPHQLDRFSDCFISSLANKRKNFDQTAIIICVESAMSILNLRDILLHASRRPSNSRFYVDGVCFGSDDFCADMGVSRTVGGSEIMYARQHIVLAAKAFGLHAIDMVYIDYKDAQGLQRNCEEGTQLGFTGKQVIHPDQVSVVQAAYSPSEERVACAREMVDAFDEYQKSGQGAFTFRDKMIDMPSVLQAKHILEMHDKIQDT